ncbi:hypothetical protein Tco_0034363 [Tanacetum coccineum]|uniref:Uncharacterized protein n=1 Tax=Tanacetum coccineum TaxID=301880 RepID=A0ABQ5CRE0_9ASTR
MIVNSYVTQPGFDLQGSKMEDMGQFRVIEEEVWDELKWSVLGSIYSRTTLRGQGFLDISRTCVQLMEDVERLKDELYKLETS